MTWHDLPDSARVWIYTASRQLTEEEQTLVQRELASFVEQWTAHRRELAAYADVLHGRFVRIAVDESLAGASGCSIDASVRFLQQLGQRLGVDFFERLTFFADTGEGFLPMARDVFVNAYRDGTLNDSSTVVDTLVDTKRAFDAQFVRPLGESWHARLV